MSLNDSESTKSARGMLERYGAEPSVAAQALLAERVALALNPAEGPIGGERLIDLMRAEGMAGVLDAFDALLSEQTHAIYDIRRIFSARQSHPTRLGNVEWSLRSRQTGPRDKMQDLLDHLAAEGDARGLTTTVVGEDGIMRLYQYQRAATLPAIERYFVVAPALPHREENARFDQRWAETIKRPDLAVV